jgi:uncharacterized membrane protein
MKHAPQRRAAPSRRHLHRHGVRTTSFGSLRCNADQRIVIRPATAQFDPQKPQPVATRWPARRRMRTVQGTTTGHGYLHMKWLHIIAGLLALASGAMALFAAKGGTLHRRSGMVFVAAMWVMTSSAVLIAAFLSPNRVNVVAGLLTFYLVSTSLLTVRRRVEEARTLITCLMLVALAVGSYAFLLGFEGLNSARGLVDKVPAPPLFMFGVVGVTAALLDARLLRAGSIEGAHRLARHLWRMTFALWIATASFFLGQAKFFPAPIRQSGVLAVPVLVVLLMLLFWLVRVFVKRRRPAASTQTPQPTPPLA